MTEPCPTVHPAAAVRTHALPRQHRRLRRHPGAARRPGARAGRRGTQPRRRSPRSGRLRSDDNVVIQYGRFLGHALTGDLGTSSRTGLPVADSIAAGPPVTLELAALSLLLAVVVGIGAGVVAAVRRGQPEEWLANAVALIGLSVPTFWLGIVLVLDSPSPSRSSPPPDTSPSAPIPLDNLRRMVLPAVVLGSGLAAVVMRQTRGRDARQRSPPTTSAPRAPRVSPGARSSAATRCATASSRS